MKKILCFYLSAILFVSMPTIAAEPPPQPVPAEKQGDWIMVVVICLLVIGVGGCAAWELKKFCDTHLSCTNAPTIHDMEGAAESLNPPATCSLPPLFHGDTSPGNGFVLQSSPGNSFALQSSANSMTWSDEYSFQFLLSSTDMTVIAWRGTNIVAGKTAPIINGRAILDLRDQINIPMESGAHFFRTVTPCP